MAPHISVILGLCAAIAAVWLIQPIVLFVQLLRGRILPMQVISDRPPRERSAGEGAALHELLGLGFHEAAAFTVIVGEHPYEAVWLRHASAPAFASITFQPSVNAGYPVVFWSALESGRLLATSNRVAWNRLANDPRVESFDPYAATLAAHWQAHQARIADARPAPPDTGAVLPQVQALTHEHFSLLQSLHRVTEHGGAWYPSLGSAARVALNWTRVQRRLRTRYIGPQTDGDGQNEYYARLYEAAEAARMNRAPRRSVKAWTLFITAAASLVAFAMRFDWTYALEVIVILFVHESGHALAMRRFGYRDLSMFFVPLIGAMVTGTPREIPAWKQAIVLFAGPMPGLLLGVAAVLLNSVHVVPLGHGAITFAIVAVVINLFNLLPISPLDGGRLVELALMGRWPALRVVFAAVSLLPLLALAFWRQSSSALFVVVAFSAAAVGHQVTLLRLQSAWQDGLPRAEQVRALFARAQKVMRVQTFARQYQLVRAVFNQRAQRPARAWESAATMAVLVCTWAFMGLSAERGWAALHHRQPDARTTAQRQFDRAFDDYNDSVSTDAANQMQDAAGHLAAADPRHTDLRVSLALEAAPAQRWATIAAVLREGRPGLHYDLDEVEEQYLAVVTGQSATQPPGVRVAQLGGALDQLAPLSKGHEAGLINARLWLAEATDRAGDAARAATMLDGVRQTVLTQPSCRAHQLEVEQARAWFDISHGRAAQAAANLANSPFTAAAYTGSVSGLAYAWALLESGQVDAGVIQMRKVAYYTRRSPGVVARLLQPAPPPEPLLYPLDMAYALQKSGNAEAGRALITRSNRWACLGRAAPTRSTSPWGEYRDRALAQVAQQICPAPGLAAN